MLLKKRVQTHGNAAVREHQAVKETMYGKPTSQTKSCSNIC